MKKTLVVLLALFLAIPAISYAGSATSRWDLTIGGDVQFNLGWSTQSGSESGNDMWNGGNPDRNPQSPFNSLANKYGTQLWGAGQTGLNFFVKGPDAWGAKTHALIVGDFTGFWGAAQFTAGPPANYNEFDLLIAEIGFDWANTSLAMGVNGSWFGAPMTWTDSMAWTTLNFGDKGAAPIAPQVTLVERFTKEISAGIGVMSDYNGINELMSPGGSSSTLDANMFRNPVPGFQGKIAYSSDSCGKLGPWQLLFEADGFWGEVGTIFTLSPAVGGTGVLQRETPDEWFGDFKVVVPIIPEHNGNKQGGLLADGMIFIGDGAGQAGNWDGIAGGAPWLTAQFAPRTDQTTLVSPTFWGFYGHAQYYILDNVRFNGYIQWSASNASRTLINYVINNPGAASALTGSAPFAFGAGVIRQEVGYVANIVYDVNPAIRLTFEWDYEVANYAPVTPSYQNYGSANAFRIGAYYFF